MLIKNVYLSYYYNSIMGALKLRNELIEQFNLFIQDDSKIMALDGIFDFISSNEIPFIVPEKTSKLFKHVLTKD